MVDFNNNMRGVLFKNERKEKPSHADYRGQCEINNVAFWIDAWINTSKDGRKFMSLTFKPKDQAPPAQAPRTEAFDYPFNDDISGIPF